MMNIRENSNGAESTHDDDGRDLPQQVFDICGKVKVPGSEVDPTVYGRQNYE